MPDGPCGSHHSSEAVAATLAAVTTLPRLSRRRMKDGVARHYVTPYEYLHDFLSIELTICLNKLPASFTLSGRLEWRNCNSNSRGMGIASGM